MSRPALRFDINLLRPSRIAFILLFLSGCALFRSDDTPDEDSPYPDITPIADFDPLTETATLPSPTTVGTNTNAHERLVVYNLPSPNFDERRLPISLIVLHYTAAPLRKSLNALRSTRGPKRVSAHYVIAPNGTIYLLVDESKRAWHAGTARWGDIDDVNSASIGIEMVNLGKDSLGHPQPYPAQQIEAAIRLCLNIQARYNIRDVVGHSDVAPKRKIDPGEHFPWDMLAKRGVNVRKPAKPEVITPPPAPAEKPWRGTAPRRN